jgi:nitrite reductase/ring-hydroxylating ferredoxin subunit
MGQVVCELNELTEGTAFEFPDPSDATGQETLIVIRLGATVVAYRNICPHAGRPLNWAPGRFLFAHGQLVCAAHGASFRPEDGYCLGGPCKGSSLAPVTVRVEQGQVEAI